MRPHDYFLRGGARSRRVGSGVRRYRGRRRVHHGRERDRHAHIRARVRYGGRRARAPAPRAIDAECFYLRNDIPVPSERRRYRAGSLSGLRVIIQGPRGPRGAFINPRASDTHISVSCRSL